jgi:uncharacterized membrane protein YfcA
MLGLSPADISLLALAALFVGFSKTAVGGVSALSIAIFAAVLPARESTGALLPLLLVGDIAAVRAYRRHTDWPALLRLLPSVVAGVVAGAAFVAYVDDTVMRRTIGALLLAMAAYHLWQRRRRDTGPQAEGQGRRHSAALAFGLLAGFTTMVANAGGPAMSLYLLSMGYDKFGFLGTFAWFFLLVNAFKVPFSVGLGLIDGQALARDAVLAVAVLAGAAVGRACVHRIDQKWFDRLVLLFTVVASVNLLR